MADNETSIEDAYGESSESWTSNSFQASEQGFSLGRAAIGYENNPDEATSYARTIQTLVPSGMTNVYLRTHFQVDNPSVANDLQLILQYDDGAVVYLNGTKVLSLNAPDLIDYNTPAITNHDDTLALQGETFDLSTFVNLLVSGQNALAIHALNRPGSTHRRRGMIGYESLGHSSELYSHPRASRPAIAGRVHSASTQLHSASRPGSAEPTVEPGDQL